MPTTTMSLTDFLLARIAEDEALARAAVSATGDAAWGTRTYRVVASGEFDVADASVPSAAHIARHDPARVLAECEAKRQVLGYYDAARDMDPDAARGLTHSLRCITAVYADHPDYRPEWRP